MVAMRILEDGWDGMGGRGWDVGGGGGVEWGPSWGNDGFGWDGKRELERG